MLPAMSEAEAEVFKFLEECPRGEDAAGAKIIFWEITRELEREILIKVGQCFYSMGIVKLLSNDRCKLYERNRKNFF